MTLQCLRKKRKNIQMAHQTIVAMCTVITAKVQHTVVCPLVARGKISLPHPPIKSEMTSLTMTNQI